MTNVEIAKRLLQEAKEGKLNPAILPHFINSLQFGAPVPDPKAWIDGIADSLPGMILPSKTRMQLKEIAARWTSKND